MKLISWNVNGLRACLKNGFTEAVGGLDADIICLQETKMEQGQADTGLSGYFEYWNSADKKGYSGTAIFSRTNATSVTYGIGIDAHDHEGRVITLEFPHFYLVNAYVPNSQRELLRLSYRMTWEVDFLNYISKLDESKPVILCGDLNVAHEEIDIKNAASNRRNAGFTNEERERMSILLQAGFVDCYRTLNPGVLGAYTWWSYMPGVRERNVGWRIDYFIASQRLLPHIKEVPIHAHVYGSDHCPVGLTIEV